MLHSHTKKIPRFQIITKIREITRSVVSEFWLYNDITVILPLCICSMWHMWFKHNILGNLYSSFEYFKDFLPSLKVFESHIQTGVLTSFGVSIRILIIWSYITRISRILSLHSRPKDILFKNFKKRDQPQTSELMKSIFCYYYYYVVHMLYYCRHIIKFCVPLWFLFLFETYVNFTWGCDTYIFTCTLMCIY